jgi:hypothetical protein
MPSAECNIFLSHAGNETEAARAIAKQLRDAGVQVWLDVEELKPGDRWMADIEYALQKASAFAVYVGQGGIQQWVDLEVRVALDRSVKNPEFRIISLLGQGANPDSLPAFLRQFQWVDLQSRDSTTSFQCLIGTIFKTAPQRISLLRSDERPFRGLQVFDSLHAHLFFGRDIETSELLDRLRRDHFVTVTGASGSGKSSLVRAGLIPSLNRGRFHDGKAWVTSWRTITCRPGNDPFGELARAAVNLDVTLTGDERIRTIREAVSALSESPKGLGHVVASLVPPDTHSLIIIDQFEELFNETKDRRVRAAFIDSLLTAADMVGNHPIHIVVTLRADFYGRCWEHPCLPGRIANNQLAVPQPRNEALRDIIEKPIALAGARFEAGLVERILQDLGEEPGNLPLLEFALDQLWDRASISSGTDRERLMTHQAYDSIGGVSGAIAREAESVLERLTQEHHFDEDQFRTIFTRLVRIAGPEVGGGETRRRILVSEFDDKGRILINALVDARLLVTSSQEGSTTIDDLKAIPNGDKNDVRDVGPAETETIEIAHEALIKSWDRLKAWLAQDRNLLVWRQRLLFAMNEWERSACQDELLLRGLSLSEAAQWLVTSRPKLSSTECNFIERSLRRKHLQRRRVQTAITLVIFCLLVGYIAMADMDLYVPGKSAIQNMIDDKARSIFRPVPRIEDISSKTETLRGKLASELWQRWHDGKWLTGVMGMVQTIHVPIPFSSAQGLVAFLGEPLSFLTANEAKKSLEILDALFSPALMVEEKGIKYGWRTEVGAPDQTEELLTQYPRVEPILVVGNAVAVIIAKADLGKADRQKLLLRWANLQEYSQSYASKECGGWNVFPNQKGNNTGSTYSTTLGLSMLLAARTAGLPWNGTEEARDDLIRCAVTWLTSRYREAAEHPGWPDYPNPYSDGLNYAVFGELIRAQQALNIQIPSEIIDGMQWHVRELLTRTNDYPNTSTVIAREFTHPKGHREVQEERLSNLWYPNALVFCALWSLKMESESFGKKEKIAARRCLGHLVVDLGDEQVNRSKTLPLFINAEILRGLNAVSLVSHEVRSRSVL